MEKIKVGLIFGGPSTEHEVSIRSAASVLGNLDATKYSVLLIAMSKDWKFFVGNKSIREHMPDCWRILSASLEQNIEHLESVENVSGQFSQCIADYIDVCFPMIHGYLGEDGSLQGMCQLLNIPYVGSNVIGSACCMNKAIQKKIVKDCGIPIAKSFTIYHDNDVDYDRFVQEFGHEFFVKPSTSGSSVGVSKVHNENQFNQAISEAFLYDDAVIIEEYVAGQEVECAVLGNRPNVEASGCGEIILRSCEFYDYRSKYIDSHNVELAIPANLSDDTAEKIRECAKKAFMAMHCDGFARVDFLVRKDSSFVLTELNTLPGFTSISMYPKLWEAAGIPYKRLLTRLIDLAFEKYKKDQTISHSFVEGEDLRS